MDVLNKSQTILKFPLVSTNITKLGAELMISKSHLGLTGEKKMGISHS